MSASTNQAQPLLRGQSHNAPRAVFGSTHQLNRRDEEFGMKSHRRNVRIFLTACSIMTGLTIAGCPEAEETENLDPCAGDFAETSSSNNRRGDVAPEVSDAVIEELVAGNNAFAVDFYDVLRDDVEGDENLFCSPLSLSMALAMTYAGTRGETADQIADAMHFTLDQDDLHPAFGWLDVELDSRGANASGDDEPFRLHATNSIWSQRGYPVEPDFLDVLAESYDSGIRTVDFENDPESARSAINDWTSCQTEDRIEELIPEGGVDDLTRLVLVNAIYFNADWTRKFEEASTFEQSFTRLDGEHVEVPMMHNFNFYRYTDGTGYQALEMLYEGNELGMVVLLPSEGGFEAFEDSLAEEGRLDSILEPLDQLADEQVQLTIPKFEFATPSFQLEEVFRELGMNDAFEPGIADLTGISAEARNIARIFHQAFVAVDEEGTEAAAATAVVTDGDGDGDSDIDYVVFNANRPFIFLIRDLETGTILFLGRVMNPAA